jgi:hypothetical protein
MTVPLHDRCSSPSCLPLPARLQVRACIASGCARVHLYRASTIFGLHACCYVDVAGHGVVPRDQLAKGALVVRAPACMCALEFAGEIGILEDVGDLRPRAILLLLMEGRHLELQCPYLTRTKQSARPAQHLAFEPLRRSEVQTSGGMCSDEGCRGEVVWLASSSCWAGFDAIMAKVALHVPGHPPS